MKKTKNKTNESKTHNPTKATVVKLIELLSHGLIKGLGKPEPGKMCVEAAVNFALGLPHGDEPPCVGRAVRAFKIELNDCDWPSELSRAEGMLKLAITQLGSDTLSQKEFGELMFLRGTQRLLSFVLRKDGRRLKDARLIELATACEAAQSFEEAMAAASSATAYDYAADAADATAYALDYAAAASAAAAAAASAAAYAAYAASAAAYASAYASATSAYASDYPELLTLTARVGVDVLKEMKSPGCKWLRLISVNKRVKLS